MYKLHANTESMTILLKSREAVWILGTGGVTQPTPQIITQDDPGYEQGTRGLDGKCNA